MGAGSEVMFGVTGSIEFFHEANTLREIMDSLSVWRVYREKHKEAVMGS